MNASQKNTPPAIRLKSSSDLGPSVGGFISHSRNLFISVAPFTAYNWNNLKIFPGKYTPETLRAIAIPQGHDRPAGRTGVVENKQPVELIFLMGSTLPAPSFSMISGSVSECATTRIVLSEIPRSFSTSPAVSLYSTVVAFKPSFLARGFAVC